MHLLIIIQNFMIALKLNCLLFTEIYTMIGAFNQLTRTDSNAKNEFDLNKCIINSINNHVKNLQIGNMEDCQINRKLWKS